MFTQRQSTPNAGFNEPERIFLIWGSIEISGKIWPPVQFVSLKTEVSDMENCTKVNRSDFEKTARIKYVYIGQMYLTIERNHFSAETAHKLNDNNWNFCKI